MADENLYTFENPDYKKTYWHTCSHVLAQAMKRLHPEVKLAIGPAIENGFFTTTLTPRTLLETQLAELEAEMRKICKEKLKLGGSSCPGRGGEVHGGTGGALQGGAHQRPPRGRGHLFLQAGGVHRPVRRPPPGLHRPGQGQRHQAHRLQRRLLAGDSNRQTLQRIYGIAFPKKEQLDEYLAKIEEAKRRDHRKLGKELGLFMLTEEGPGFPFFLPKGMVLKNTLLDYWRACHKRYGYVEIATPIILNQDLWHRSGHWDHYKDNMYTTVIDGEDYAIKPMNCPGGMLVYKNEPHSYRDLPLRMAELGLVHRHEMSGALHGLFRVRCFTQDDAHIFMTPDQMKDEIKGRGEDLR